MERLDFNAARMDEVRRTTLRFTTCRDGHFDGLHLHLNFELDEDTRVDSYSQRTSWTCTFARLFEHEQAIWLPAGSTIECECDIDASTHCPRYAVAVRVSHGAREPLRRVGEFSWSGDG